MSKGRAGAGVGLLAGLVLLAAACADGGNEFSPWLYCTTNPCEPLALSVVPTPPALSPDPEQAAPCDYSSPGANDGILRWHTDWDPETAEGACVSPEEAGLDDD
ncbi:MAG: hypothetical protein HY723_01480 [Chloroflexi bacterium]|nr:hypothetical protein [Chloroflexota bacterium]